MNPAPPVTRTRFSGRGHGERAYRGPSRSMLVCTLRVILKPGTYGSLRSLPRTVAARGSDLPVASLTARYSSRSMAYSGRPSTSRWMRPRYSPTRASTKPCTPSTKITAAPRKQRPREVRLADPVRDGVDPEHDRRERADEAEDDARPLDRLWPEAGKDVEREPRQPQRRVARCALARGVPDVDLGHRGSAREDQRLGELLPPDRAEHRRDDAAPIGVERTAEVGDVDVREAAEHPVDQPRGQRPTPGVVAGRATAARHVVAGVDRGDEPAGCPPARFWRSPSIVTMIPAASAAEACVHRRVLAEVPLEADRPDARDRRRGARSSDRRTCRRWIRRRRRRSRTAGRAP